MSVDKDKLRQRITATRELRGLTQAQLADRAKITPAAISQIESGARTPMLPVLSKIAAVLGVSLDFLAGRSESPDVNQQAEEDPAQVFYRDFQSLSARDQELVLKSIEFMKKKT